MTDEKPRNEENQKGGDTYAEMIRSLPRMRDHGGNSLKEFVAPPPTLVRIGAAAQGCTGILLALLAIPMVLVSLWSGYYLWGPGLFLIGGIVLTVASVGIWRGMRLSLIVAMVGLIVLGAVATQWMSFVPAVVVLSPLGELGLLFDPVVRMLAFLMLLTLIILGMSALYWRRLHPWSARRPAIWVGVLVVLIGSVVILNFTQTNQIKSSLEDSKQDWIAEAKTDTVTLGANVEVTLGSSFLTADADTDPRLDVRLAELAAVIDTGASPVRIKAGGDMWLEAVDPMLYRSAPGEDETPEPLTEEEADEAQDRVARQQGYEAQYLTALRATDAELFLSDSFSSQYLLTKASLYESIAWDEFAELHTARIRRYAEELQPAAYEVVSEPSVYQQYSGLEEVDDQDEDEYLENWVAHTEELVAAVEEVSPETLIGVSLWMTDDFDKEYYQRVLEIDGIDFVGVRMYQLSNFDQLTEDLAELGHPQDYGKQLWIVETWYGYCLAPQRSMEIDADWLEASVAYAAKENVSAVYAKDLGCFLQEGGSLFADTVEEDGRTGAFEVWQELVQQWSVPLARGS